MSSAGSINPRGRPQGPARRARAERGSGTVLMLTVIMVLMITGCAVLVIGSYLIADHRAQAAADLSALAAGEDYAAGGDGCGVAHRIAKTDQAEVTSCQLQGDWMDFVVTVEVSVSVTDPLPGLPERVFGKAYAGPAD